MLLPYRRQADPIPTPPVSSASSAPAASPRLHRRDRIGARAPWRSTPRPPLAPLGRLAADRNPLGLLGTPRPPGSPKKTRRTCGPCRPGGWLRRRPSWQRSGRRGRRTGSGHYRRRRPAPRARCCESGDTKRRRCATCPPSHSSEPHRPTPCQHRAAPAGRPAAGASGCWESLGRGEHRPLNHEISMSGRLTICCSIAA